MSHQAAEREARELEQHVIRQSERDPYDKMCRTAFLEGLVKGRAIIALPRHAGKSLLHELLQRPADVVRVAHASDLDFSSVWVDDCDIYDERRERLLLLCR